MLVAGGLLAYFLYRGLHRDRIIFLVYLYAYIGIIVRYINDSTLVTITAAIVAIALLVAFIYAISRKRDPGTLRPA